MLVSRTRALIVATVVALALPVAAQVPTVAMAAPAGGSTNPLPGPNPGRTFTAPIEAYASYLGQTVCDPVVKPGARKLSDLLRATYGSYSVGITRPCSDGGVSEHKEGRALDWMVSIRDKTQKAQAQGFLAWLLAPDEFGSPAAMARRLGIMYIGWNNKMWRAYDPGRGTNGWDDLKGCSTNKDMLATSYDTYCHRNHIHLSLSWDGAAGTTSFWTGKAIVTPDCARRSSPFPLQSAGAANTAAVLLDTGTGAGTIAGAPCRLGAERWSGDDRTLRVQVPMPLAEPGVRYGLRVRVERYVSNAPGALRLDTAASAPVLVPARTALPYVAVLPIGANGVLAVSTTAGESVVRVVGLGIERIGTSSQPPAPPQPPTNPQPSTNPQPPASSQPKITLHTSPVVTGSVIAFDGRVSGVPATARVQRYLKVGTQWQKRGPAVVPVAGRWRTTTAAPSPQLLTYRVGVVVAGQVLAWSGRHSVAVMAPPRTSLRAPAQVGRSTEFVLKGKVTNLPAGATVQRLLRVGSRWQTRGAATAPARSGAWAMSLTAPRAAAPLVYRVRIAVGSTVLALSRIRTVAVR